MSGGHIEKPTLQYAKSVLKQTKEMYEWLKNQL